MLRLSGQISNLSHVSQTTRLVPKCFYLYFYVVIDRISSQENEQLRGSLLQAQTNIAILHSELDKLKNVYADQKAQHER